MKAQDSNAAKGWDSVNFANQMKNQSPPNNMQ